jgi:serine-type D-Ala-D-Ala carboxypeptidase/endopeptidase
MLTVQRPTGVPGYAQALGWDVTEWPSGKIISKDGVTGGYHTFIGFNPESRVGVVLLSNAATVAGSDDIARHVLLGTPVTVFVPPLPPPRARHAIVLPPDSLKRYVGDYRLAPQVVIAVTREGDHLFAQATGEQRYEIFPETPTDFFSSVADVQASFDLDPGGRVLAVVLHKYGRDHRATPIASAP